MEYELAMPRYRVGGDDQAIKQPTVPLTHLSQPHHSSHYVELTFPICGIGSS
jgi:hypothetical protein